MQEQHDSQDEIARLFAHLGSAATAHSTEEHEAQDTNTSGPVRLIDIHIYDLPALDQQDTPTVESTLDDVLPDVQSAAPYEQADEEEPTEPATPAVPHPKRRTPLVSLLVVVCCLLLAGAISITYILPLLAPSATITIVPISRVISTTDTITVVTGKANTSQHQIAGRALATLTMSQAQTVPTTGKGHQDARSGHGLITFYNASLSAQVVTAGTVLTGADGVQVVIDQDAVIPAGTLSTNGQATVVAHAVQTGPAGNIKAGDIYGPCCRLNVFAANSAFTGGQEARDYQTVTQQDLDRVSSSLKTSLTQSVQAALQAQVHPDETLITPPTCKQTVTPDHQEGDEAKEVSVTASATCSGEAYSTKALTDMTTQLATQAAAKQLGEGYNLVGQIQSSIKTATPKDNGTVTLLISSAGTWAYQFDQERLAQIKSHIAGRRKDEAMALLLHTPGVLSVSISLKNGNALPTDPSHIQIVQLVYPN